MSWRWIPALGVVGLLLAAGGCGNPCGELADRTCEKVGAEASLCKEARKRAEAAAATERATCERALKIYEAATAE